MHNFYLLPFIPIFFIIIFYFHNITQLSTICYHKLISYCKISNYSCITKCKNSFNLFKIMFKLTYTTFFILIMQKINKFNIKHLHDNIYSVQFVIGGKIYKIFIQHSKNPSNILQIIDQHDNDVTNDIEPIFNTNIFVPCLKDFNLTELTIMDSMGDDHTLTQNDKFDI